MSSANLKYDVQKIEEKARTFQEVIECLQRIDHLLITCPIGFDWISPAASDYTNKELALAKTVEKEIEKLEKNKKRLEEAGSVYTGTNQKVKKTTETLSTDNIFGYGGGGGGGFR